VNRFVWPLRRTRIALKQYTEVRNVGDLIGPFLVEKLSRHATIPVGEQESAGPNLMLVGSILHWADQNTVVCGAGVIAPELALRQKPKAVLAVRGPLSATWLEHHGVEPPTQYGDPGLLLRRTFRSAPVIEHEVGIVPHYVDQQAPLVDEARRAGIRVIDVTSSVPAFVRQVRSCRRILSSSLHGLVVADSFGIPSQWMELSDGVHGAGFKFRDYYLALGETPPYPIRPATTADLEAGAEEGRRHSIRIDLDALERAVKQSIRLVRESIPS
jgi:pyruvyltransferase